MSILETLLEYIDAKIDYEFASREPGEDGMTFSPAVEEKRLKDVRERLQREWAKTNHKNTDDDEQLRKYCEICKRVTDWEDGFNIVTGIFSEWCAEHDEETQEVEIKNEEVM